MIGVISSERERYKGSMVNTIPSWSVNGAQGTGDSVVECSHEKNEEAKQKHS